MIKASCFYHLICSDIKVPYYFASIVFYNSGTCSHHFCRTLDLFFLEIFQRIFVTVLPSFLFYLSKCATLAYKLVLNLFHRIAYFTFYVLLGVISLDPDSICSDYLFPISKVEWSSFPLDISALLPKPYLLTCQFV